MGQRRNPQDDQNDSGAGENLFGHARRVYHTGCPLEAASWLRAHPCADEDAGGTQITEPIQLSAAGGCGRARDRSLPVAPGPTQFNLTKRTTILSRPRATPLTRDSQKGMPLVCD
jgi:hypothetical protein